MEGMEAANAANRDVNESIMCKIICERTCSAREIISGDGKR